MCDSSPLLLETKLSWLLALALDTLGEGGGLEQELAGEHGQEDQGRCCC